MQAVRRRPLTTLSLGILLVLVALARGQAAEAPAFFFDLSAGRLASLERSRAVAVLVVGEPDPLHTAAGAALAATLQVSGHRVVRVEDVRARPATPRALGQRCAAMGAEVLAIVEILTASDGVPRALVDLSDRAGTPLGHLVGTRASTTTAPSAPTASPAPAAPLTVPPPLPEPDAKAEARAKAEATYAARQITLIKNRAYLGLGKTKALDGTDFYAALGRPDLVSSYRTRRGLKIGCLAVSGAVFSAGVLWVAGETVLNAFFQVLFFFPCLLTNGGPCESEPISEAPIMLMGVGLTGALVSALIPIDPMGETDRRALVRDHNRRLRLRLDLPPPPEPVPLRVTPLLAPGVAGLALSGRF